MLVVVVVVVGRKGEGRGGSRLWMREIDQHLVVFLALMQQRRDSKWRIRIDIQITVERSNWRILNDIRLLENGLLNGIEMYASHG